MRIYISVDAEGMPGIFSPDQVDPKGSRYAETRQIMTEITLSVCEELHKSGVDEVMIADSHDGMGNIYYEKIPRYATLISGSKRPVSMMTGVDQKFDGAMFLGYHAAAGSLHSTLDHTFTGKYTEVRINDTKASEFYINLLIASRYRVPVLLVGGDNVLEQEVKERAPWIQYVRFKESVSRYSNISPSLESIRTLLAERVKRAMENQSQAKVPDFHLREISFIMKHTSDADDAELIPGLQRVDAYTLRYECEDIVDAYKMMQVIAKLG